MVFKIMMMLQFRFSCARHGRLDVVWVSDVSSITYSRMDKELKEFIADKKFNKTLPKLHTKYFT
jgi:hypothetical protein